MADYQIACFPLNFFICRFLSKLTLESLDLQKTGDWGLGVRVHPIAPTNIRSNKSSI